MLKRPPETGNVKECYGAIIFALSVTIYYSLLLLLFESWYQIITNQFDEEYEKQSGLLPWVIYYDELLLMWHVL